MDFVLSKVNGMEVPIEVKYRGRINPREMAGLASFLGKTGAKSGLVISKSRLETRQEYVVPASAFLLLT